MSTSRNGQEGFAYLIGMATLISVGAAAMYGQVAHRAMTEKVAEYVETKRKLDTIEDALFRYAARERKLPCPADGSKSDGVPFTLDAATNRKCDWGTGKDANFGVVPWRVLGIEQEDTVDEWGGRISYRVYDGRSSLTSPSDVSTVGAGGVNLSECIKQGEPAPPVTAAGVSASEDHCLRHSRKFQLVATNTGFLIPGLNMDPTNAAEPTGAVFVLMSHGENGRGAWRTSGQPPLAPQSADELANRTNYGPFVAKTLTKKDDPNFFDDLVRARTLKDVAEKAGIQANKSCAEVYDPYVCYVIKLGPVAYWRLGETSSQTSAADIAGYGITAKNGVYNGTVTRGQQGAFASVADTAAYFDLATEYVTIPHDQDFALKAGQPLKSGAVSLWFRTANTGPQDVPLFAKGANFHLKLDKSWLRLITGGATITHQNKPGETNDANGWNHVVIMWGAADPANGILTAGTKLYLNRVGLTPASSATTTLEGNVAAIKIAGKDGNAFKGKIDEVVFFNRQLVPDEVNNLFTKGGTRSST